MAYIIPSKNIFDVNIQKLVDNKISAVEITEKQYAEEEVEMSQTFSFFEAAGEYDLNATDGSGEVATLSVYKTDLNESGGWYLFPTLEFKINDFVIPSSISVGFEFFVKSMFVHPLLSGDGKIYCSEESTQTIKTDFLGVENIENLYRNYTWLFRETQMPYNKIRFDANNSYKFDGVPSSFVPQKGNTVSFRPTTYCFREGGHEHTNGGIFSNEYYKPFLFAYMLDSVKVIIKAKKISKEDAISRVVGTKQGSKTFKLDENEFPASYGILPTTETAIEETAKKIINAYKNGKETATVVVGVSNFKDTTVLPEKYLFCVGDIVCPFVNSISPLSVSSERKAKLFLVNKNKTKFDGEVLQELSLIECGDMDFLYGSICKTEIELSKVGDHLGKSTLFIDNPYTFDADWGLNDYFSLHKNRAYWVDLENGVSNTISHFYSPKSKTKVVSRSGNKGEVIVNDRVSSATSQYGWYIKWEKKPTDEVVYIDAPIQI